MGRESASSEEEDLARFHTIARGVRLGWSLTQIGKELGKTSSNVVADTLARLELRHGEKLVQSLVKDSQSHSHKLTNAGEKLWEELQRVMNLQLAPDTLKLHVSHSLLTLDVMSRALPPLMSRLGNRLQLDVSLRQRSDFDDLLSRLVSSEFDIAISWATQPRLRRRPGIKHEIICHNIPLVVVFRQGSLLEGTTLENGNGKLTPHVFPNQLLELSHLRCVSLSFGSQAGEAVIPVPMERGRRIEVDTIEAQLAMLRCHGADFAVVPEIALELERHRTQFGLRYARILEDTQINGMSPPSICTCVAAFYAERPERHIASTANIVIDRLKQQFNEIFSTNIPISPEPESPSLMPDDRFFKSMKYGYYLDIDRKPILGTPKWRQEIIVWQGTQGGLDEKDLIVNQYGDKFFIETAEIVDRAYIVKASLLSSDHESRSSVPAFVSVFNWFNVEDGLMYGTWNGLDADGIATAFATIWSNKKIDFKKLRAIASRRSIRLVLNSQEKDTAFFHSKDQSENNEFEV
jgi:hypothetical protein